MPALNEEQVQEARSEMIRDGVPVRFLLDGRNLDIITGDLQPKGTNVIHQIVYWNFSRETSKKIAAWLGCTVIFSE